MTAGFTENEYIRYRLDKARQTLNDAEILAHEGSWNSAMNQAREFILLIDSLLT